MKTQLDNLTPELDLDFVRSGSIHPALKTNRTWKGFRRGRNGLLVKNTAGVPELDYNSDGECMGLRPMHSSINRMVRTPYPTGTEAFLEYHNTNGLLQIHPNTELQANAATGPTGANDAWKIKEKGVTANTGIGCLFAGTSKGKYICNSFFAKAAERRYVQTRWWSGDIAISSAYVAFDLQTGQVYQNGSRAAGMEYYGNGWWRCWAIALVVGTANTGATDIGIDLLTSLNAPRRQVYQGTAGYGLYVWGVQIEEVTDLRPNSIIYSEGSSVTVSGEYFTLEGIDRYIGKTEGALFVEFVKPPEAIVAGSWRDVAILAQNTYNSAQRLALITNNESIALHCNGQTVCEIPYSDIPVGSVVKAAFSYSDSRATLAVNGASVQSEEFTNPLSYTKLHFGGNPTVSHTGAYYRALRLWNTAVSAQHLGVITK